VWDVAFGYFTGLRLFNPELTGETLLRTAFVVHTCNAVMCRLLAYNNGHSQNRWTALGFIFGFWALAVIMVLPRKKEAVGG
jgi:hypothetical protein